MKKKGDYRLAARCDASCAVDYVRSGSLVVDQGKQFVPHLAPAPPSAAQPIEVVAVAHAWLGRAAFCRGAMSHLLPGCRSCR